MQASLRKNQNTLYILGASVVIFGIWTIIKFFLSYYLGEGPLAEILHTTSQDSGLSETAIYLGMMVFLLLDLLLRLFVGLSAMAEGQGRKKGRLYVVFAWIMTVFGALSVVLALAGIFMGDWISSESESLSDSIISLIIEFTAFIIILDLSFSAVRVKKLQKQGVA